MQLARKAVWLRSRLREHKGEGQGRTHCNTAEECIATSEIAVCWYEACTCTRNGSNCYVTTVLVIYGGNLDHRAKLLLNCYMKRHNCTFFAHIITAYTRQAKSQKIIHAYFKKACCTNLWLYHMWLYGRLPYSRSTRLALNETGLRPCRLSHRYRVAMVTNWPASGNLDPYHIKTYF